MAAQQLFHLPQPAKPKNPGPNTKVFLGESCLESEGDADLNLPEQQPCRCRAPLIPGGSPLPGDISTLDRAHVVHRAPSCTPVQLPAAP
ncbi:hypothetical protein AAFF_G00111540 [Aldrovandia affinis]|uniref:Uncharacterized protein n=1 Tax=Aldrovandia affinis TaxID=143900 RepID=A0AAD7RTD0_9TELE|nr:hypothetical protein AAFF_G00111540 [Aldrovandia affinis]